jgi:hypothetical protein
VGKKLEQVCFTVNTVDLNFDGDISITLMTSFLLKPSASAAELEHTVPARQGAWQPMPS